MKAPQKQKKPQKAKKIAVQAYFPGHAPPVVPKKRSLPAVTGGKGGDRKSSCSLQLDAPVKPA